MKLAKLVFILLMKKIMLKIGKLVVLLLVFDVAKKTNFPHSATITYME